MDDQVRTQGIVKNFFLFMKFNMVGIVNTVLTYGIYAAIVALGAHHLVALLFDYAFGMVFSFIANKRLTFKVETKTNRQMVFRMIAAYVPILVLNAVLLDLCIDAFGVDKYLAQAASLIVVTLISFAAQRFFVFGKEHTNGL